MSEVRKLAAILVADIVGCSRLARADDEGTLGVNVAARLEGVAPPDGICLSEDAWRQVKGRIDLAAQGLGPVQLKNIAEPIRVFALAVGCDANPSGLTVFPGACPSPAFHRRPPLSEPRPRPRAGYFVDGITESLTSDLSRISGAFVIARNTAFEHRLVRLVRQTRARARQPGMVGKPSPGSTAAGNRGARTNPRNARRCRARCRSLEVADHVHAEIPPRRKRRRAHPRRVIRLAHPFNERVEPSFPKQVLQAIVERVSRRARHLPHVAIRSS